MFYTIQKHGMLYIKSTIIYTYLTTILRRKMNICKKLRTFDLKKKAGSSWFYGIYRYKHMQIGSSFLTFAPHFYYFRHIHAYLCHQFLLKISRSFLFVTMLYKINILPNFAVISFVCSTPVETKNLWSMITKKIWRLSINDISFLQYIVFDEDASNFQRHGEISFKSTSLFRFSCPYPNWEIASTLRTWKMRQLPLELHAGNWLTCLDIGHEQFHFRCKYASACWPFQLCNCSHEKKNIFVQNLVDFASRIGKRSDNYPNRAVSASIIANCILLLVTSNGYENDCAIAPARPPQNNFAGILRTRPP